MLVRVIRPYMSNGSPTKVGDTVELEDRAARALIYSGKAERADDAPIAPAGPMTTETADGLVSGGKRRKSQGVSENAG